MLRPLLLVLALSASAWGQNPLGAVRQAFAEGGTRAAREQALAAAVAAGVDGEQAAQVLLEATRALAAEIEAMEEERHRLILEEGRQNKPLQARAQLDAMHELGRQLGEALGGLKEAGARRALLEAALTDDALPLGLRLSLAGRAGEVEGGVSKGLGKAMKRARDPGGALVAIGAIRALGGAGIAHQGSILRLLKHGEPVLREEAALALAALARPESVEPLIERLAKEKGTTRARFGQALEILTRQQLGDSERAWRRWWKAHEDQVLAGELPLGGGEPSPAASDDDGTYYGIPMSGQAILFVVDLSKSMNRRASDGGKVENPGEPSRWDLALKELTQSLDQLKAPRTFNIVLFAGRVFSYADEMVPAKYENVYKAKEWLSDLELELGTALYDGLDLAFHRAGRGPGDHFYSAAADTIFLLTHGRPMRPKLDKPVLVGDSHDAILAAVHRWNLRGRLTLHTIGLGTPLPKKLLEALASDHGGRFVHVK